MKTYSGELTRDTPCREHERGEIFYYRDDYADVNQVYHDNEWQLYKPQAKKVWGIPIAGQKYYEPMYPFTDKASVVEVTATSHETAAQWLSQEHAEQHAKALNMANEFRLLSDVPVNGVKQWCVNSYGAVEYIFDVNIKLYEAIFGVVFNTREQAEEALAKFPQIHIANKIIQFGFHGIVEERL